MRRLVSLFPNRFTFAVAIPGTSPSVVEKLNFDPVVLNLNGWGEPKILRTTPIV